MDCKKVRLKTWRDLQTSINDKLYEKFGKMVQGGEHFVGDVRWKPRIIYCDHLWSGGRGKAGGLSRLSLSPLFVLLFVKHILMLREIYAYIEAVNLRELMHLVGLILQEHISPILVAVNVKLR